MFALAVTAAAGVVGPALIEAPAAAAQGATSTTLHISPTSGPVGTVIEVTGVLGAGCSATNAVVSFTGAAPNTGSDNVYAPHPSSGAFAAQVVVPSWIGDGGAGDGGTAVRTGTYMVQVPANCTQVQPPVASVPFTVTSTAVPPARFVGMAATPDGGGYWLVNAGGGVFSYGDAAFHGSLPGLGVTPAAPIVGIASTADGGGYWLVGADGGVYGFGDAAFHGSLPGLGVTPAAPIVGIAATPSGGGYWLAAADSGIFAFGDAAFYGDTVPAPGSHTSEIPTSALLPTPDGHGYYEVHVAGTSVEAFGPSADLRVTNPTAGTFLNAAALSPDGRGLWQAGTNGGVYAAGSAPYDGSLPGLGVTPAGPIVGMASTPHGSGYWLVGADGGVYAFGDAGFHGSAAT